MRILDRKHILLHVKRLTWYKTDKSLLEFTRKQRRTLILLKRNCHGGKYLREAIVISLTIVNISVENTIEITDREQSNDRQFETNLNSFRKPLTW